MHITTCLWFTHQASEAAKFYTSLFKNSVMGKTAYYSESGAKVSGQKQGSVMTVEFELAGQKIMALNGGPDFKQTPALSFFVWCDTEEEITHLWQSLSQNGTARMPLGSYPWSEKYGWTTDQFGVEWQLMLGKNSEKLAPAFLFVDKLYGRGEEAVNFYLSLFDDSKIEFIKRDESTNAILHCIFTLAGNKFVLMEGQGSHGYTFSPAFSLVVNCETQAEIDHYWNELVQGGAPSECGWLTDKFGVSWQIVPALLKDLMSDENSTKTENVMHALLQMTKLDLKVLQQAAKDN